MLLLNSTNSPASHRDRHGPVEFDADVEGGSGAKNCSEHAGGSRRRLRATRWGLGSEQECWTGDREHSKAPRRIVVPAYLPTP